MHLAIFLVLGPLVGLMTAMYAIPPLFDLLFGTGTFTRSGVASLINFPPMPVAYALGFFPALTASRLDHSLNEARIAILLRAFVVGAATMLAVILIGLGLTTFMPLLTVVVMKLLVSSYKVFLLVGLIGFLPGFICSLAASFFWAPR